MVSVFLFGFSRSCIHQQSPAHWTKSRGGGFRGTEVGGGGGVAEGHRAVEVIFFIPLRWARVEQPTGSRTGGTFLLRAE